jgi:hypothetical protein
VTTSIINKVVLFLTTNKLILEINHHQEALQLLTINDMDRIAFKKYLLAP